MSWILTNNNLPTVITNFNNSCTNSVLTPITNLTNAPTISTLFNVPEQTISVTPGTVSNTYTIQLLTIPNYIRSGNVTFTDAVDYSNPVSGEFTFINGVVTIYSPLPLTTVSYVVTTLRSMKVNDIPSIFGQIPIYGEINITDSWQDHPTCTMNLITSIQYISEFRNNFKQGNLLTLYQFGFYVYNYSENIDHLNQIVTSTVSLRGKWDAYVNRPIPLIKLNDIAGNYLDPDCQIFATNSGTSTYLSLNTLANRIGANITGINLYIKVKSVTANQTTTLSTEINNVLDINQAFVNYSNNQNIEVRKINGVNSFSYSTTDLIAPLTTTINRLPVAPITYVSTLGTTISGVTIKHINQNTLVPNNISSPNNFIPSENISVIPYPVIPNYTTPNNFESDGTIIPEPTSTLQDPLQQRKIDKRHYFKGDTNADVCPTNVTILKTLDLNYDRSGVTKTSIEVYEEDGFPTVEITRKYGFAYRAVDIVVMLTDSSGQSEPTLQGNPTTYWQLIEQSTKTYNYDENTGYLLGYDSTGMKLLRVKAEDDSLPTEQYYLSVTVQGQTPATYDTAVDETYRFQWVPLYNAKRYLLAQHRDYYESFQQSEQSLVKVCNRDGSSSFIDNPNYVESMFAIEETEETICFLSIDNPLNLTRQPTEPIYPPLTTGQETYNRTIIQILDSQNTNPGFIKSLDAPKQDRYITYTSNFSAQEPGFDSITEQTTDTTSDGIPSIHTRKPSTYELVNILKENPNSIYKGSQYHYVVWTQPYTGGYPRLGTYSFPSAKTTLDVFNAIGNQLKIDDVRNTLSSSCTIPINLNIRGGDKITIAGFKRRVISANHNLVIQGIDINGVPLVTSNGTQLSMGIEREPLQINRKLELANKTANNTSHLNLITKGINLGSILPNTLPGRGK